MLLLLPPRHIYRVVRCRFCGRVLIIKGRGGRGQAELVRCQRCGNNCDRAVASAARKASIRILPACGIEVKISRYFYYYMMYDTNSVTNAFKESLYWQYILQWFVHNKWTLCPFKLYEDNARVEFPFERCTPLLVVYIYIQLSYTYTSLRYVMHIGYSHTASFPFMPLLYRSNDDVDFVIQ